MGKLHEKCFPNESDDYRTARNKLLQVEIHLKKYCRNCGTKARASLVR